MYAVILKNESGNVAGTVAFKDQVTEAEIKTQEYMRDLITGKWIEFLRGREDKNDDVYNLPPFIRYYNANVHSYDYIKEIVMDTVQPTYEEIWCQKNEEDE